MARVWLDNSTRIWRALARAYLHFCAHQLLIIHVPIIAFLQNELLTVWLLIFEGDLFSLFSRVLHDLRKLKKYQNFDPKNADSAMAKFSS